MPLLYMPVQILIFLVHLSWLKWSLVGSWIIQKTRLSSIRHSTHHMKRDFQWHPKEVHIATNMALWDLVTSVDGILLVMTMYLNSSPRPVQKSIISFDP